MTLFSYLPTFFSYFSLIFFWLLLSLVVVVVAAIVVIIIVLSFICDAHFHEISKSPKRSPQYCHMFHRWSNKYTLLIFQRFITIIYMSMRSAVDANASIIYFFFFDGYFFFYKSRLLMLIICLI